MAYPANGQPLKRSVTYSRTVNLGNYESARFEESYEFYEQQMNAEQAFEIVMNIVEKRIAKFVNDQAMRLRL